ncbi:hypothetical protein ABZ820_22295 [Streptomyces diacarni]|uniref:hypothetical protein n=1 Tax=Streptomyces diacarni TaxID=2800381 RepID=UPI00340C34D8
MADVSMTHRPSSPTSPRSEADRRLGEHLLDAVRAQDARIPAERRAPRTVAEMRARISEGVA